MCESEARWPSAEAHSIKEDFLHIKVLLEVTLSCVVAHMQSVMAQANLHSPVHILCIFCKNLCCGSSL